jgi:ferric-dicitrate binding protein FerR (iron transport regulator)
MDERRLYGQLVQRYLANTATKEELDLFFHLLEQGKLDAYLQEALLETNGDVPVFPIAAEEKKLARSYKMLRYVVAASLLLAVLTGFLLYRNNPVSEKPTAQSTTNLPQAAPGTRKAILTLSDGQSIQLGGDPQNINDGGAAITTNNSEVVYTTTKQTAVAYNTIATPKGGEYQVTLPDGTQVWLNAETSLRYPTSFTGSERRVELTGEAYFEVAKNAKQPFIVQSGETVVKVLGTHFNIMAYPDESIQKTTLTEGSVALSKGGGHEILKPGQAGTIAHGTNNIVVASTDIEQDLAWKNGNFYFQKTELSTIMKQLARWYDLEIRYSGTVPKKRFVGKISRYTNLSDVLDVLRLSDIKFSMTGKTLTVEE